MPRVAAVTVFVFALLPWLPALVEAQSNPWDAPPFAGDPLALLDAAKRVPAGEGVDAIVLREELRYSIDREGRVAATDYQVFRLLTRAAVTALASPEARWSPWRQTRPTLRARIITVDGGVHSLDPNVLTDAPVREDLPEIYNDTRVYGGPLPAVAEGAIIEVERTWRDTAPFFGTAIGRSIRFAYAKPFPMLRKRLIVELPPDTPFQYVIRNMPGMAPVREENRDRVRWIFESGPMEAPELQDGVPLEVHQWPAVAFSTGASWSQLARAYSDTVDRQIDGTDPNLLRRVQAGTAGAPQEIAARLVEHLQHEIRYTGVEFGDAAIVPRKPADVLNRRFGDCKDEATLLVAMLRASGIHAYVALLNARAEEDPELNLPGLEVFDHAIVVIPGEPVVWIDPTDRSARVGELPVADQGRLALIAAPDTTALVRVPETSASNNRQIRTHEFFLDPIGPARVVETSEAFGVYAGILRSAFRQADPKTVKEGFNTYVKDVYQAKDLGRLELPRDVDAVPVLRVEALKAARGYTDLAEAAVAIRFNGMVSGLPERLLQERPTEPRTVDFFMRWPFVQEWRYRIHVPAGFRVRELPATESRTMGPATFSRQFRLEPDNTVTGMLQFDSGPRRISAKDLEALRVGVADLRKAPPIIILFDQTGERLLAGGRTKEALKEFRALVGNSPQSGLQHMRVARALLSAGLGEAARIEAQRAAELEPNSAVVHRLLGRVLEADLLGRPFKKGFDRAGAEAAYRRALAIDPDDAYSRTFLAFLLEHDDNGVRYAPEARLAEAIEEYKKAAKQLRGSPLADNLPIALLRAGRYGEMKEAVQANGRASRHWAALWLAALAATDGSTTAIREAASLTEYEAQRREALGGAAVALLQVRLYGLAADLMDEAAHGAPDAATLLVRASLFRQMRRHEDVALAEDDPRSVVSEFLRRLIVGNPKTLSDELNALASRYLRDGSATTQHRVDALRVAAGTRAILQVTGVSPHVAADAIMAMVRMVVDGQKEFGYRIRSEAVLPGAGAQKKTLYVIWEDDRYRILGFDDWVVGVGRRVWDQLERGDLDSARRWLNWIREDVPASSGDGYLLALVWPRGAAADRDGMLDAAAALVSSDAREPKGVERLLGRLEHGDSDSERTRLRLVLAYTLLKRGQASDSLQHGQVMLTTSSPPLAAFNLVSRALMQLGRYGECRGVVAAWLQRVPDDPAALRVLARIEGQEGRYDEAERIIRRLIVLGKADAEDWNRLAWGALFRPPVTEQAVRDAQQGLAMRRAPSYASLHTLAALYAEMGKSGEARDVVWQAMEVGGLEEPDSSVWLVLGRIAVQFDARDAAIAAYKKVEKPSAPYVGDTTSYALAQQRLAELTKSE